MVLPGNALDQPDFVSNKRNKSNFKFGKIIKTLLMAALVIVPVIGLFSFLTKKPTQSTSGAALGATTTDTIIAGPIGSTTINRDFMYPLTKKTDGPVLVMSVVDAEKRKEILVKGKKATAIEGRAFLILNLKFKNDSNNGIEVDSRDYFRLSTNGNQAEWLAPDIHNDPVEVQAISTKTTRIGFPINENDTQIVLQVGELEGSKEQIPLTF